jgi:hypothetical protein
MQAANTYIRNNPHTKNDNSFKALDEVKEHAEEESVKRIQEGSSQKELLV